MIEALDKPHPEVHTIEKRAKLHICGRDGCWRTCERVTAYDPCGAHRPAVRFRRCLSAWWRHELQLRPV